MEDQPFWKNRQPTIFYRAVDSKDLENMCEHKHLYPERAVACVDERNRHSGGAVVFEMEEVQVHYPHARRRCKQALSGKIEYPDSE